MNNNFNLKQFLAEGRLLKEDINPYTEVIENLFKTFEVTDLKTFNDELNYSDLVDAMCEEMGGDTTNGDDMSKARDILKKYATDKFPTVWDWDITEFGDYDKATNSFHEYMDGDSYADYMDTEFPGWLGDEDIATQGSEKYVMDIVNAAKAEYGPDVKVYNNMGELID
jgi:hypothetical protein